jgi:hypothetical protein
MMRMMVKKKMKMMMVKKMRMMTMYYFVLLAMKQRTKNWKVWLFSVPWAAPLRIELFGLLQEPPCLCQ